LPNFELKQKKLFLFIFLVRLNFFTLWPCSTLLSRLRRLRRRKSRANISRSHSQTGRPACKKWTRFKWVDSLKICQEFKLKFKY
jgi:hypothetical protein